jgi:excisionase family DNA binding protein
MTDFIELAAGAIIARDVDAMDETFRAALVDHTKRTDGRCTRFELRACLRAIFTRVIEIYNEELSKAVPEVANGIQNYFAGLLRKQLDFIDSTTDEFMTVEQAAELVTIGKQSIRRWVQNNQVGEYDPVERRYLVSRRRLRNYLRDRRGSVPDRV